MVQQKLFAVSVADAYLRNTKTDTLVVKGKALLTSSMEQTMQENEIYAGRGSKLQYTFNYQKLLTFTIEASDFSPTYIALQTGSEIKNKLSNYFTDESVTFDASGKATLSKTPIGKVYVETNGGNLTVTPTTKEITVSELANTTTNVAYQYETTVEEIVISAEDFPQAYELTLISDIFNADGSKAYEQQIQVPYYKLDGALSLSLTHDGVSSFTLGGKSLVDSDGNYAYIKYLPVEGTSVPITMLATNPSEVQLNATETETLTVYGIRPAPYGNIIMDNTKLTFSSDDTSIATVDANGVITAVATGNTTVRVTDGSYTDVVDVEVLA